eukprot:349920-Chlamydomonas_euryale.AAC.3
MRQGRSTESRSRGCNAKPGRQGVTPRLSPRSAPRRLSVPRHSFPAPSNPPHPPSQADMRTAERGAARCFRKAHSRASRPRLGVGVVRVSGDVEQLHRVRQHSRPRRLARAKHVRQLRRHHQRVVLRRDQQVGREAVDEALTVDGALDERQGVVLRDAPPVMHLVYGAVHRGLHAWLNGLWLAD